MAISAVSGVTLLIVLIKASIVVCSTTAPSSHEVSIVTSEPTIHEGFTKHLAINCSFNKHNMSEFAAVISLIISKSDTTEDTNFKDIATVSLVSHQVADVKNDLGADVKAHMSTTGDSYISYEWNYPPTEAQGNYRCSVAGLGKMGHVINNSDQVTVSEANVNLQMILAKIQVMEHNQDALMATLDKTRNDLDLANGRLNATESKLNSTTAQLDITKAHLNLTDFNLNQTKLELDLTKGQLIDTNSKLNTTTTELDLTQSKLNQTISELSTTQSKLNHTAHELNETKEELHMTNAKLNNTNISLTNTLTQLIVTEGKIQTLETDLNKTKIQLDVLNSSVKPLLLKSSMFVQSYSYKSHEYLLSTPVNVSDVDETCRQVGGYLVQIDDRTEYDALTNYLRHHLGNSHEVRIGGTDAGHEGKWTFAQSGQSVTFFKWGPGQPDGGSSTSCLELHTSDMTMWDYPCDEGNHDRFICEIPS